MPYMVDPNAAQSVAIWADNPANGLDYVLPVVSSFSNIQLKSTLRSSVIHVEMKSNSATLIL